MEICKCTRRLGGTTMLRFVSQIIFLLEEGEWFSLCVSIYLIKTGQKKNSGGHYGIYLGDSLYYISSAPCPTFNNDPLFLSDPKKPETVAVEFEGYLSSRIADIEPEASHQNETCIWNDILTIVVSQT